MTLRDILSTLLEPLWQRLKRGEGALIGVAGLLIFSPQATANVSPLPLLVVAVALLGCLYGFNDWHDAARDLDNAKKNQQLARLFVEHRRATLRANLLATACIIAAIFAVASPRATMVALAIFFVNGCYSLRLKSLPVADVAIVGLWGGLFTGLFSSSLQTCLLIGLMTAVSHVFQAETDRRTDQRQAIRTIASRPQSLAAPTIVVCSVAASMLMARQTAWPIALLPMAPPVLRLLLANPQSAWLATKAIYAVGFAGYLGYF